MSRQTFSDLVDSLEEAINDFEAGPNVRFEKDLRWNDVEKILDLLDKVIEKDKGRVAGNVAEPDWSNLNNCDQRASRFMEWLQIKHGVETRIVSMMVNDDRTKFDLWLMPNRTITDDEVLFSIPPEVFMTGEAAAKKLKYLGIPADDSSSTLLTLFLMYEKYVAGDRSNWKAYIDVLPSIKYYNVPICFTKEDLVSIKECRNMFCEVLDAQLKLLRMYCMHYKRLSREKNLIAKSLARVFTFERYLWAKAVMSLSFIGTASIGPKDGELIQNAIRLIPLVEMCEIREDAEPLVGYQSDCNSNYVCHTIGAPEVPFKLTRTYGLCSLNYLLTYGYVPETPAFPDKEIYRLSLSMTRDPFLHRRQKVLHAVGLSIQETFELKPEYFLNGISKSEAGRVICKQLYTFVHIFQAKNELLERIEQGNQEDDLEFLTKPSKEAWNFLAGRFEVLSRIGSKYLAKSDEDWSNEKRNITSLKSRERLILQYVVNELYCVKRFVEIAASRRDNDPDDVEGPEEDEDTEVVRLTKKTEALFRGLEFCTVTPAYACSKEVFGPTSARPRKQDEL